VARITNISGEDRDVPLLGGRTVADGETVEVDDQLLEDFAWPESTWKVETTASGAASSSKKAAKASASTSTGEE
jgi:hypothetical protein